MLFLLCMKFYESLISEVSSELQQNSLRSLWQDFGSREVTVLNCHLLFIFGRVQKVLCRFLIGFGRQYSLLRDWLKKCDCVCVHLLCLRGIL